MSRNLFSRGRFIGLSAAAIVAASCGAQEGKRPSRSDDSGGKKSGGGFQGSGDPGSYKESPMLAQMVEAGDLPPVKERLPGEPFVVEPGLLVGEKFVKMQPGKYGGTLQLAQEAPSGDPIIFIGMDEPILWAPSGFDYSEGEGIQGNVVAGYEANSDDTEFTFHMREGLRWSDGEPVTIEDVKFAFEDVMYNEEITPVFPLYLQAGLRSDAAPAKLNVIDDMTFSLTFDSSVWDLPGPDRHSRLARLRGHHKASPLPGAVPQKVRRPQKAQGEARRKSPSPKTSGSTSSTQSNSPSGCGTSPTRMGSGHPTLTAWIMKKADNGVFTYERNPYYFKVDPNGNQLPYMDGIRSQTVQDKETLTARALMGEFDYLGESAIHEADARSSRRRPSAGEIKTLRSPAMHVDPTTVFLNLTYDDDNWRKVVRDIRFRRALSLAINRKEIIENFYLGEFARLPERDQSQRVQRG